MFQAIRSPRDRVKSLLFNRAAVDHAFTECAFLDPLQRVSYELESSRIRGCFLELPIFFFVSDARVAPLTNRRPIAEVTCVCISAVDPDLRVVVLRFAAVAYIPLCS